MGIELKGILFCDGFWWLLMEIHMACPIAGTNELVDHGLAHGVSDARHTRRLEELERVGAHGAVLDIGCGDGRFLALAHQRGWRVAGVESPGAVRLPEGLAAQIRPALEEGQWPAGSFDAVTLWETLDEHVRPAQVLQRAAHYCRVDGILGVALDSETTVHRPALPEDASPLRCFTLLTLHRFLGRFGFRIEWVVSNTPPHRPLQQMLEHPGRTLTRAIQAFRQPQQQQREQEQERGGITVIARYVP